MPATMSLTSSAGTYNFHDFDLPIISRAVEYVRHRQDMLTDKKRVNVILEGFFTGNTHDEIITKYQNLKAVLDAGDRPTWVYNDGVSEIANGPVSIRNLNEPGDWKQYDGSYRINFDYLERASLPAFGSLDTQFKASFTNSAGTINLHPIPKWQRTITPNKNFTTDWTATPSAAAKGAEVTILLEGTLTDASLNVDGPSAGSPETNIYDVQDNIINILTNKSSGATGTLNYGFFSEEVYIDDFKFSEGINIDSFDYTITAKYWTEEIIKMSLQISHSRVHQNPEITERPFCGDRRIKFGNTSGQEVSYSLSLRAESVSTARSLLATEVAVVVVPGGIELPGGTELWDYDNRGVNLTIKKFYDTPILSNLGGV